MSRESSSRQLQTHVVKFLAKDVSKYENVQLEGIIRDDVRQFRRILIPTEDTDR